MESWRTEVKLSEKYWLREMKNPRSAELRFFGLQSNHYVLLDCSTHPMASKQSVQKLRFKNARELDNYGQEREAAENKSGNFTRRQRSVLRCPTLLLRQNWSGERKEQGHYRNPTETNLENEFVEAEANEGKEECKQRQRGEVGDDGRALHFPFRPPRPCQILSDRTHFHCCRRQLTHNIILPSSQLPQLPLKFHKIASSLASTSSSTVLGPHLKEHQPDGTPDVHQISTKPHISILQECTSQCGKLQTRRRQILSDCELRVRDFTVRVGPSAASKNLSCSSAFKYSKLLRT